CLAVPVLPLGNYAFGLAALYGIAALIVLGATWRTPRAGLVAALGAGLGPIGALGLLPVAGQLVRWPARRAVSVAGSVLVAAALGGDGGDRPRAHARALPDETAAAQAAAGRGDDGGRGRKPAPGPLCGGSRVDSKRRNGECR